MISVIIPTMFIPVGVTERIKEIANHHLVSEVILIDNTPSFNNLEGEDIPNLVHIKEGCNTFVNPAWNKGVQLSKEDKLLIINDDVITDFGIIDFMHDLITEDKGMIGAGESCWNPLNGDEQVGIREINHRKPRYGSLFFIHKNSYRPIPEEMKVWYGDDWLFYKSGKPRYEIMNWPMGGGGSQTVDLPQFHTLKINDGHLWHSKYINYL